MIALDTRNCAYESVVHTVRTFEEIGARQYKKYVSSVIENRTVAIHDTISNNFLPQFKWQDPKQVAKESQNFTAMTSDRFLFSRLYIGSQQRDGDLDEFFMHENQSYPPPLSKFGNLRSTKKSDLIECMTKEIAQTSPQESYTRSRYLSSISACTTSVIRVNV